MIINHVTIHFYTVKIGYFGQFLTIIPVIINFYTALSYFNYWRCTYAQCSYNVWMLLHIQVGQLTSAANARNIMDILWNLQ